MLSATSLFLAFAALSSPVEATPSKLAQEIALHARKSYAAEAVRTLADLVRFDTYHREGTSNAEHPSFRAMTAYLEAKARELGLDFVDHGAVVVLGLGQGEERLGVVTHGDVQPADGNKWARSPFELDTESEPGRLVGRGTEDDKGPIVCALYAMRAIADRGLELGRRIELIISYTEESNWTPFGEFLAQNPPPQVNVAFDAEYPVVIAEKGWCSVQLALPLVGVSDPGAMHLASFTGGFFLSQVPEDAEAIIQHPSPELEAVLLERARRNPNVAFDFTPSPGRLRVRARGTSAHSSKPWEGHNAIAHLADLLAGQDWPANAPAQVVDFLNRRIGTGYLAEKLGDVAYADDFMGPLTLSTSTLTEREGELLLGINLRRPVGRTSDEVEQSLRAAVDDWIEQSGASDARLSLRVGEPYPPQRAPHVDVLLATFRHYTGQSDVEPVSIGGGTHARMVPGGVNFGPSMPGERYTGHSEHEFLTREQFELNLLMYTSLLVDLAGPQGE